MPFFKLSSCIYDRYINEIEKLLVPNFISIYFLEQIKNIFNSLPSNTTSGVGLEFNPSKYCNGCDISISIDPLINKSEIEMWSQSYNNIHNELFEDYLEVCKLARYWINDSTVFRKIIDEIILEFDILSSFNKKIPLNIFLSLHRNQHLYDICRLLSSLKALNFNYSNMEGLKQLICLEGHSIITHLGFMTGRKLDAIRVLIKIETQYLLRNLNLLKLDVSCKGFKEFYEIIDCMCDYIVLAINVTESFVHPTFAIECGWTEGIKMNSLEWWNIFLTKLKKIDLFERYIFGPLILNNKIRNNISVNDEYDNIDLIKCGINHVKIKFKNTEEPELKWYMYMHCFKNNKV